MTVVCYTAVASKSSNLQPLRGLRIRYVRVRAASSHSAVSHPCDARHRGPRLEDLADHAGSDATAFTQRRRNT